MIATIFQIEKVEELFELIHEINLINYLFSNIKKLKLIKKNYLKKQRILQYQFLKHKGGNIGTLIQDMLAKKVKDTLKFYFTKYI